MSDSKRKQSFLNDTSFNSLFFQQFMIIQHSVYLFNNPLFIEKFLRNGYWHISSRKILAPKQSRSEATKNEKQRRRLRRQESRQLSDVVSSSWLKRWTRMVIFENDNINVEWNEYVKRIQVDIILHHSLAIPSTLKHFLGSTSQALPWLLKRF